MRYLLLLLLLCACGKRQSEETCPSGEFLPAGNGKPTILVIGDSISIGYTKPLKAALPNYDVVHNPCNAMNSNWTLQEIDGWLEGRQSFEAITWNNGLWDIASWGPTDDATYAANLHFIAGRIKAKTSKPLFILTTMVPAGTPYRSNADVLHKNQIAVQVMQAEGIPVLDLYTLSLSAEHSAPYDVHYSDLGSSTLALGVLNELDSLYGIH